MTDDRHKKWYHPHLSGEHLDEIQRAMNYEVSKEEICKIADLLIAKWGAPGIINIDYSL